MAIGQLLSEVDIVVRPYGRISHGACFSSSNYPHAFVVGLRNCTSGIDEVTVRITALHIAHVAILGSRLSRIVARQRRFRQRAVLVLQVFVLNGRTVENMIVVTLVEVEAVQVVSHRTVVEFRLRHRMSIAGSVVLRIRIVAVDSLLEVRVCRSEDGLDATVRRTAGINPAVLHVAITSVNHTSRGERTGDTEVIDTATELAEQ